jgi:hypothetical protein
MIARDGPSLRQLSDHSVEVDVAAAQYYHYVAGVISGILKPKFDHRSLAILLLQRLKLKRIRIRDVSLRVVRYSLFFRHS